MKPRYIEEAFPGVFLVLVATARPWLEATMFRHMVIEIPVIFMIGWVAAWRAGLGVRESLARWNAYGIPALLYASLAGTFWMMPVALDSAVLQPAWGILKMMSVVSAGFLLGACWHDTTLIVQSFFVINAATMLVTGGLLYQQALDQLCSVYFAGQQSAAGAGLLTWGLAILGLWLVSLARHPMFHDRFVPGV